MSDLIVPRTPWPTDFPDVVIHAALPARDQHPDFPAAKAGDRAAALRLAVDLVSPDAAVGVAALAGPRTLLLPVSAVETDGFNAIPDAMAQVIGTLTGLARWEGRIVQSNRVGHTRASGWRRLVAPALFEGEVAVGREYFLVDDHVGLGGTLANLRGYVETSGGRVVGMTTLTESRDARTVAVRRETLIVLRSRHGQEFEDLWNTAFGYGSGCLTELEAGVPPPVNFPLTPSEIEWLKQQSRLVGQEYRRSRSAAAE